MKEPIILIGGGGHCKSCIDVIEQEGKYNIEGILDLPEKIGGMILGYKIIASDHDIPRLTQIAKTFFITLGHIKSPNRRIKLFELLKSLNQSLPTIIANDAYVSKHASIGEGTIVMHNAIVNAGALIGSNCIINTKSIIEHDAVIGDNCHISTGAIVNGGVNVGKQTFFGSGAVSKQYITIPDNSFIKANSILK